MATIVTTKTFRIWTIEDSPDRQLARAWRELVHPVHRGDETVDGPSEDARYDPEHHALHVRLTGG